MKIVAGIDGGGTGTVIELHDLSGNSLGRKKLDPFNLNSIGQARFEKLLNEIFKFINSAGECKAVCIGAAGISNPSTSQMAHEAADKAGLSGKLHMFGDHEIALYGATGGKAGCILISGTGSICTGRSANGKVVRSGGWGHLIDDAGSGYALGRDALSEVVQACDGRRGETVLTDLIFHHLHISGISELIALVYNASDKSFVASLSPLVDKAAEAGDEAALRILRHNAQELARLVQAVCMRLENDEMPLVPMGSLLAKNTPLRASFITALHELMPKVHIGAQKNDAASGAALLAASLV